MVDVTTSMKPSFLRTLRAIHTDRRREWNSALEERRSETKMHRSYKDNRDSRTDPRNVVSGARLGFIATKTKMNEER